MNLSAVKQELKFIGGIIELLDNSIITISDTATDTNNKELAGVADFVEEALERLVTRELELERVAEVLNDFEINTSHKSEGL